MTMLALVAETFVRMKNLEGSNAFLTLNIAATDLAVGWIIRERWAKIKVADFLPPDTGALRYSRAKIWRMMSSMGTS